MAATSAGEKKKKNNSVILSIREYCMDLVSLETQQENDYIQNWLDSRNLTYTWTSGRWAYIQCPHTFIMHCDTNTATFDPQFRRQALWLWRLWPTRLAANQCQGVVLDWVQQEDCTNQQNQWRVRYEWVLWEEARCEIREYFLRLFPTQAFLLQLGLQAMEQHWPSEKGSTRQCRVRYQQVRQFYKFFPW